MVNRILIRIKVVQMLYSYLLTRSDFRITPMQRTTSRDKKYGYELYQDLMLLILELSGVKVQPNVALNIKPELKMRKMSLITDMQANDEIRRLINRGESHISDFNDVLPMLANTINTSVVWRDYKKLREPSPLDQVNLWKTLLQTTFVNYQPLLEAYKKNPNFTFTGLDRGINLTVESLNEYVASMTALSTARHDLERSLKKAYDLYLSLLLLIINLTDFQEKALENAKGKYLASPDDLNPNTKFIDNQLVARLRKNPALEAWANKNKPQWVSDPLLLRRLREDVVNSDVYSGYMRNPQQSYKDDCEFWRELLKCVIFESEPLAEALESESIFWNDDMHIISTFVLKTIRLMSQGSPDGETYQRSANTPNGQEVIEENVLPNFKDEEDERFGEKLFMWAVDNQEQYRDLIDKFVDTASWDADRIAFMDIVIMTVAIAEIMNCPEVPLAVTMNEYVEIANYYSTNRSGQFVNGLLYSVAKHLNEEGLLHKK